MTQGFLVIMVHCNVTKTRTDDDVTLSQLLQSKQSTLAVTLRFTSAMLKNFLSKNQITLAELC